MESFQMFCIQPVDQFKEGILDINSEGEYSIGDHVLSEGEVIYLYVNNQFVETSIHFSFNNIYSSDGYGIDIGDIIRYETDL